MELFTEKNWYKGNLHCHTTLSDGRLTPEECMAAYREKGYDFLCITDHRRYFAGGVFDGLVVLPGAELHRNDPQGRHALHMVALGIGGPVENTDDDSPRRMVEGILEAGGMAIVAHPAWSMMHHSVFEELEGAAGLEVYNTISQSHSRRGYSQTYADALAARGRLPLLFAVDDAHFYDRDVFGGFVWVNADASDAASLMAAIREGRFYSSQGPRIEGIRVEGGHITAQTSPASSISFISDVLFSAKRVVHGSRITRAEYTALPNDRVVRVEVEDAAGRLAWSNYIKL